MIMALLTVALLSTGQDFSLITPSTVLMSSTAPAVRSEPSAIEPNVESNVRVTPRKRRGFRLFAGRASCPT